MKTARLVTLIGCIALSLTACLHGAGFINIVERVQKESLGAETAAILKTCWLTLSVELITLALIAFLLRGMERGGGLVVLCGVSVAANGLVMLHFLGPFIGVYVVCGDAILILVGGYLQMRAASATA